MWTKEMQAGAPVSPSLKESRIPMAPVNVAASPRTSAPAARSLASLGSTIVVKGEISSDEDLQIDGKVEGNISLGGHRLTIGRGAHLNSEIHAREVIVYGSATGNLHARDRVEIKKDGQVIGDITTARISIEDGAHFKGSIEIERPQSPFPETKAIEKIPAGGASF